MKGRGRNTTQHKICQTIIIGGVARLNEHLARMIEEVKPCAKVSAFVRECMIKLLFDNKIKKINHEKERKI